LSGLQAAGTLRSAALDAADAAHVLGHHRIPRVFDDTGARDVRAKRLLRVHDDLADAAHVDGRIVRNQFFGLIRAGPRDRDRLLPDAAGNLRSERAGAADAKRRRLQVVDGETRAARGGDAQRLRVEPSGAYLHAAVRVDDVQRAEA
jgi:hypothetical protein